MTKSTVIDSQDRPILIKVTAFDCRAFGEPYAERTVYFAEEPVGYAANANGFQAQVNKTKAINLAVETAYYRVVAEAAKSGKTVLGWSYEVIWKNGGRSTVI